MPYVFPDALNPKNTKSKLLWDYLDSTPAMKKLFSPLVIAAKKVDPLFNNNITEFSADTLEEIDKLLKSITEADAPLADLLEASSKFRIKLMPLSKAADTQKMAIAALKGLTELDQDGARMEDNLKSARVMFTNQRIKLAGLRGLKLDDVLSNAKLLVAFRAHCKEELAENALDYLLDYASASAKVPKTLTDADEQFKRLEAANISGGLSEKIPEAIDLFKTDLEFSVTDDLKSQIKEMDKTDIDVAPDSLWSDWETTWKNAYLELYTLLKKDTLNRFCNSEAAAKAIA